MPEKMPIKEARKRCEAAGFDFYQLIRSPELDPSWGYHARSSKYVADQHIYSCVVHGLTRQEALARVVRAVEAIAAKEKEQTDD